MSQRILASLGSGISPHAEHAGIVLPAVWENGTFLKMGPWPLFRNDHLPDDGMIAIERRRLK